MVAGGFRTTKGRVAGALLWVVKLTKTECRVAMTGRVGRSCRATKGRVGEAIRWVAPLTMAESRVSLPQCCATRDRYKKTSHRGDPYFTFDI